MKSLTTVSTTSGSVLSVILIAAMPVAQAEDAPTGNWTGNVSGFLGYKSVDDNDWQDLDSQIAIGVITDVRQHSWPVSIAADFMLSGDVNESGTNKDTAAIGEIHLGVRKVFTLNNSPFSPYIGGGVAFVSANLEHENAGVSTEEDDQATGTWVGAGTYYAITPEFNIGLDVRYSKADVTIFNQEREAGGVSTGISLGYHW